MKNIELRKTLENFPDDCDVCVLQQLEDDNAESLAISVREVKNKSGLPDLLILPFDDGMGFTPIQSSPTLSE